MKFILTLFLLIIIPTFAHAANSAVAGTALPISLWDGEAGRIIPILVTYDTPSGDLVIKDPAADEYVAIVGVSYVEADAHNVTFKSGSDVLTTYQMATNSGLGYSVGKGIHLSTAEGEDLIINSDVAITPFTVYIVVYKNLWIN